MLHRKPKYSSNSGVSHENTSPKIQELLAISSVHEISEFIVDDISPQL